MSVEIPKHEFVFSTGDVVPVYGERPLSSLRDQIPESEQRGATIFCSQTSPDRPFPLPESELLMNYPGSRFIIRREKVRPTFYRLGNIGEKKLELNFDVLLLEVREHLRDITVGLPHYVFQFGTVF
jgi:hypothetical protein